MQKSALEHGAGGQSQFVKSERKNALPLEERQKQMPRARSRIASERVADFSQVLRPRVAPRRPAWQAYAKQALKVWGARRAASPTAVYVTGEYEPVAHAQARARRARRRRKR